MSGHAIKRSIYIRIFSAFLVIYLVLMAGFTFFLIDREKKLTKMEFGSFASYANNTVNEVLQEHVDRENRLEDMVKFKRDLSRWASFLASDGTETAVFTGDYELIFNTNDYWMCSYTDREEGNIHYSGYAYVNPRDWFSEQEVKELEDYLYAEPRAKKAGDLSDYSVLLEGFWLDNEMVIPDKIRVVPMYADEFDEEGNVTSAGGAHDENNIIYASGYQNNRDLPYFEHGSIRGRNNPYYDPQSLARLREMVMDKEKLKTAVQDILFVAEKRTNFLTYQYYLPSPYKNAVDMSDDQEPYSEFWTVIAREVNLWDKCAPTLGLVWGGCLFIFILTAFTLSRQTYGTYKKREELEAQRREITNALAHDLKTPLSIISGYAQNLRENIHTEKREHYAGNIQANVERMDKIVSDMLELSGLESNLLTIQWSEVDLEQISADIMERYRLICDEKSIITSLEGEAVIKADPALIARVIDNFFVNALNHTPEGGSISIKLSGNSLEFYNSGSHIPDEQLGEIWQPYTKADVSRGSSKGTGLGLAIARGILDLHHFAYGAENREGGVVFWFAYGNSL